MKEKPDSAGIWTREGKFYRVWHSDKRGFIGDEVKPDGHLGNEVFDGNWPAGNWQKLGVTAGEARERFRRWLDGEVEFDEWPELIGEIADKAAELFAGVQEQDKIDGMKAMLGFEQLDELLEIPEPFEADPESHLELWTNAITTLKQTIARLESRLDPAICRLQFPDGSVPGDIQECAEVWKEEHDKRDQDANELQEKIARLEGEIRALKLHQWHNSVVKLAKEKGWNDQDGTSIADWLKSRLSDQPEVIEGRGQAVTDEGWYWYADDSGNYCACYKTKDNTFANGVRYQSIPRPTFPPRKPAFVAPPKPELVLVRSKGTGAYPPGDVLWTTRSGLTAKSFEFWELINPATGEPIAKEEA